MDAFEPNWRKCAHFIAYVPYDTSARNRLFCEARRSALWYSSSSRGMARVHVAGGRSHPLPLCGCISAARLCAVGGAQPARRRDMPALKATSASGQPRAAAGRCKPARARRDWRDQAAAARTMPTLVRLAACPPGYSFDLSKTTAYRIDFTIREAALSCFAPGHNEFWNIMTELAPLLFFLCVAADIAQRDDGCEPTRAADGTCTSQTLHRAGVATVLATTLQHAASLFAHTFTCCSARASRVVWYVDYAGSECRTLSNMPSALRTPFPP